jgi:hypothetical protein
MASLHYPRPRQMLSRTPVIATVPLPSLTSHSSAYAASSYASKYSRSSVHTHTQPPATILTSTHTIGDTKGIGCAAVISTTTFISTCPEAAAAAAAAAASASACEQLVSAVGAHSRSCSCDWGCRRDRCCAGVCVPHQAKAEDEPAAHSGPTIYGHRRVSYWAARGCLAAAPRAVPVTATQASCGAPGVRLLGVGEGGWGVYG